MDNRTKLQLILSEISKAALDYLFPGLYAQPKNLIGTCCARKSFRKFANNIDLDSGIEEIHLPSQINLPTETELVPFGRLTKDGGDKDEEQRQLAIIAEIDALKKKYDISIQELEQLLSYQVELSLLKITRDWRIILDDFDAREVKMDKLSKSIFFLYLKHPEGIRYKELCDYKNELEDIYLSISGRTDIDAMRKSIADLTDSTMNNSINEKVSKVKKAFRNVVDDRIAKYYYIDGKQGAIKTIALDRSLVLWE